MSQQWIERAAHGWILRIKLAPGARNTRVIGPHGDQIKLAVSAPAVDGKANEALLRWLAGQLDLPRASVCLIGGQTSRNKRVSLSGATHLTQQDISERLLPQSGVVKDTR